MAEPIPNQDGKVLHFLKELPAWCVITLLIVVFLIVWNVSHDDFIPRIIDGLVGALLTSIIAPRVKPSPASGATNITTDTINAENLTVPKT